MFRCYVRLKCWIVINKKVLTVIIGETSKWLCLEQNTKLRKEHRTGHDTWHDKRFRAKSLEIVQGSDFLAFFFLLSHKYN